MSQARVDFRIWPYDSPAPHAMETPRNYLYSIYLYLICFIHYLRNRSNTGVGAKKIVLCQCFQTTQKREKPTSNKNSSKRKSTTILTRLNPKISHSRIQMRPSKMLRSNGWLRQIRYVRHLCSFSFRLIFICLADSSCWTPLFQKNDHNRISRYTWSEDPQPQTDAKRNSFFIQASNESSTRAIKCKLNHSLNVNTPVL